MEIKVLFSSAVKKPSPVGGVLHLPKKFDPVRRMDYNATNLQFYCCAVIS